MKMGTKCSECYGIGHWVGAGYVRKECAPCSGTGLIKKDGETDMRKMLATNVEASSTKDFQDRDKNKNLMHVSSYEPIAIGEKRRGRPRAAERN